MGEMWYRKSHRWTQSSSATIIDLVSETLYFFLISIFEVCVKTKILYVNLLLTDKGGSNILTIYSLYIINLKDMNLP